MSEQEKNNNFKANKMSEYRKLKEQCVRIVFLMCFTIISIFIILWSDRISSNITGFCVISLILVLLYMIFCLMEKRVDSNNTVRILVLPIMIILIPSILLIQQQFKFDLAPLWTLFGTIVGYLLGKFDKK